VVTVSDQTTNEQTSDQTNRWTNGTMGLPKTQCLRWHCWMAKK